MAKEIIDVRNAVESQLEKTDKIIASAEAIESGLAEIHAELDYGFTKLSAGLEDLCFAADEGFRQVVYMLELQGETLEAIREILERPLDTQAKELRRRAEFAYLNGWLDEAETDLLEAEKKNYQDFIVHQILGNIYYYHKCNYQKALEYYQKAAKYSSPVSEKYASDALIYTAMAYYRFGQLSDAYESTKKAVDLTPHDPHFLFNHVRYAAKIGYVDEFLNGLKECVYKDPNYLIIADTDDMFSAVRGEIRKLAEKLRSERKIIVNNIIGVINSAIEGIEEAKRTHKLSVAVNQSVLDKLAEVNMLCARNSYLDFVKAEQIARNVASELMKIEETLVKELETAKIWVEGKVDCALLTIYISAAILTSLILVIINPPESSWELILVPLFVALLPLMALVAIFIHPPVFDEYPVLSVGLMVFSGIVLPIILFLLSAPVKKISLKAIRDIIEKIEDGIKKLSIISAKE
ncbi:MAG: hypothetical protein DDT40_01760 [candidate division WS2 bacterium]|nr:hypothetical protein [Candidatus Psychracetigena formicireducens]